MKKILGKFFDNSMLSKIFKNTSVQLFICSALTFMMLHIILTISIFSFPYDYMVGDVVGNDIVLEEDYYNEAATSALKDNVKYEVEPKYTIDSKVYAEAKEAIASFYNKAYDIRAEYAEDISIRINVFTYLLIDNFDMSKDDLTYLATMEDVDLKLTETYVYDILREILAGGVTDENIIEKKASVKAYFTEIDQLTDEVKPILEKIVTSFITQNSFLDQEATNRIIEKRIEDIDDVIIPMGTVLVKAGDPLDLESYEIINFFNLNNLHTFEQKIPLLGMDILIICILILMMIILNYLYHDKLNKAKYIYLNYLIVAMILMITFTFKSISVYLMPMATIAMLISILEDEISGIVYSFFATILYGVIFSISLVWIIMTLLSCVVSSILVYKVYQRSRIFLAGLIVSLINLLTVIAIGLIGNIELTMIVENAAYGLITGIICSVLTIGFLPLWETIFKILTPLKLLELANPNHPLMKKLLLEAPGTYHHSILVANLSEAATHDVGGNPLLARVGSYFHDIGKIDRPFLFVENQYDGNNPHDQFVPRVSAKVIKDHVKRGLALGKENKLPREILEFIECHHGTTMIKYFYHKAKEGVEEQVDSSAYTYDGPTPNTKEKAIVMMADSVEAAVRSIKGGDQSTVKLLIDKIVNDKIEAQQLINCDLTLKDIDIIKKSFISNLSSAFHERIEYPELAENNNQVDIK